MRLPQSDVVSFHLEETGFNSLQVICPSFYLHAQQVDICLIAALLQGKREQRAWRMNRSLNREQEWAGHAWKAEAMPSATAGKPNLYSQDPTHHTQQVLFNHSTMPGLCKACKEGSTYCGKG